MISFQNMFKGRNLKVFEFMLFSPLVDFRKSNLMEKANLLSVSGLDCWKQRNSHPYRPIFFVHGNKYSVVHGGYTDPSRAIGDIPAGKNGCCTWRFVFQEFDLLEYKLKLSVQFRNKMCAYLFLSLSH